MDCSVQMEILNSLLDEVNIATADHRVYKEECVLTFDSPDSTSGIYVSLRTFLGFSKECLIHYHKKTGNSVYLNIRRERIQVDDETCKENVQPERKIMRLAIGVEGGFNESPKKCQFLEHYSVVIMPDFQTYPFPDSSFPDKLTKSVESVINAASARAKQESEALASWDGEVRQISKEAINLHQLPATKRVPAFGWKCEVCSLDSNLWLNLTDGSILCGRKFFDGSGGNNHALEHFKATRYPLAVKLGTITKDGTADVFSYSEDDMVIDPLLDQHLSHWGINASAMEKTDKSMIELEIDVNKKMELSKLYENDGNVAVFGPGRTGMHNIGNSCYMNSVMQVLFTIPDFIRAYKIPIDELFQHLPSDPANDFNTQMIKLANGLLSGQYSQPPATTENNNNNNNDSNVSNGSFGVKRGVTPHMFKHIASKGNTKFTTKRQQDAHEYLLHILSLIDRNSSQKSASSGASNNNNNSNASSRLIQGNAANCFKFQLEERFECNRSHKVKYTNCNEFVLSLNVPIECATNVDEINAFEERKRNGEQFTSDQIVRPIVPLMACLELFANSETIDPFFSTAVNAQASASKITRMATFPNYLIIHLKKFVVLQDWSYVKLDVLVDMPELLDLGFLRGNGLQPHEEQLPEMKDQLMVTFNAEIYRELLTMGFSSGVCEKALYYTKNESIEAATNWIMEHMTDNDFNEPFQVPGVSFGKDSSSFVPDPQALLQIQEMGFSKEKAIKALKSTENNIERAIDWVFSHPDDEVEQSEVAENNEPRFQDGSEKYKLKAFITHLGSAATSGHYVCHVRSDDGQWLLFNDEKVEVVETLHKNLGYLFFYERCA